MQTSLSEQGEFMIPPNFKVDGYDPKNKKLYDFHGCYHHGCPKCTKANKWDKLAEKRNELRIKLEKTMCREGVIKKFVDMYMPGFEYVTMWECKYEQLMANDPVMKDFCESVNLKFIKPRAYFFGGRTCPAIMMKEIEPG